MVKFPFPIVIASALGLAFAGSALLNVIQFQRAQENQKLLQGQISDLKYQYSLDHPSPGASPATSATPAPTDVPAATTAPTDAPAPTSSPAVAGSAVVSIDGQVGVKLTATDPVADLTFWYTTSGSYQVASLTTNALKVKYPACGSGAANNALGQIVRKTSGTSTGALIKKIGNYSYFYLAPSGYCATDADGKAALDTDRAAIKDHVLATLTQ